MKDSIRQWQKGNIKAFEALFQQYKGLVFKTAVLMLQNSQEAEDFLQEVFLSMWNSRATYDPKKSNLTTWLHSITVNRCIDRQRASHPELPIEDDKLDCLNPNNTDSIETSILNKLEAERTIEIVKQLDQRHGMVLVLRYFNDFSYAEIAEILSVPIGTVKSRIYNALKLLRQRLDDNFSSSYAQGAHKEDEAR